MPYGSSPLRSPSACASVSAISAGPMMLSGCGSRAGPTNAARRSARCRMVLNSARILSAPKSGIGLDMRKSIVRLSTQHVGQGSSLLVCCPAFAFERPPRLRAFCVVFGRCSVVGSEASKVFSSATVVGRSAVRWAGVFESAEYPEEGLCWLELS